MKKYLHLVKKQMNQNFTVKFVQVLKEENEHANRLAKVAFAEHITISSQLLSFIQYSPSINEVDVQVIPAGADRMTPIVFYLKGGTLLEDRSASRRLKVQVSRFVLIRDVLYERGFS